MLARWLLGGGLVLVAGLAGVYFYLESNRPKPVVTPPPVVTLGEASTSGDGFEDLEAEEEKEKATSTADKKTPAGKLRVADSKAAVDKNPSTGTSSDSKPGLADKDPLSTELPELATPQKTPAKPAVEKQPAIPASALPDTLEPTEEPARKSPPKTSETKKSGTPVVAVAQKRSINPEYEKPPFEGWKDPAAVVLLTGEMHGYVEPCGCAIIQLGGLARRDDLLKQIREGHKWPATALDLGGMINRPHRTQAGNKAKFALDAFKDMKYAGVGLGIEDLKLDLGAMANKPAELPMLSSNIKMPDMGDEIVKPYVVTTVGETKIFATSVFGSSVKREVFTNPNDNLDPTKTYLFSPPDAALKALLPQIKAQKANINILLAHASMDEAKKLAEKFPEFNVVLAMGPEDPDVEPKLVGQTLLVAVGHKGKSVGVLGYFPNDKVPLKWKLIKLDPFRFKNSPRMVQHMRDYQDALKSIDLVSTLTPLAPPNDTEYVGAERCGDCHIRAYEKWKTTKHAHATESLEKGRKGEVNAINRINDPECLSCHVTGWHPQEMIPYKSGYVNKVTSKHLLGQQCENCHGPGAKHVAAEEAFMASGKKKGEESKEQLALRKQRRLDKETAKTKTCVMCHDHDNSPEFNFEKYWKEVEHPWKD